MKKIKKIIIGLILGLILVFCGHIKANASNLIDLNDLQNVQLQWNNIIYWELLEQFATDNNFKSFTFTLENGDYSSYSNQYKDLYIYFNKSNNTISFINNNNEYNTVWENGWKSEVYRLNNWSTPPNRVQFVYYTQNGVQSDYINPGDAPYETLIQFLNYNSLLKNIYTLTYDGNGATSGTIPPSENHISGLVELTSNYNPGNLAKEGYIFLGWNTNASATSPLYEFNMTSNTTVYAVWSKIEYTLSFDGNGQTTGTPPANINVASNENVKLSDIGSNTLAKAGYVFLGWNTNASATTPLNDITITSNTTVYAVWQKLIYYSLTYDGNGATSGTIPQVKNVVEGSTVELQNYNPGNLAKEGYIFLGWNTNASATSPLYEFNMTSNTTVYAVWSKIEYTLSFDGNGQTTGTPPANINVASNENVKLSDIGSNTLAKAGYVFLGWNTNASATTPLNDITITSNTTVYAVWGVELKKVNIKITCRDNVVWQGNATFSNNKIVGGVSWDDPTMTNVFFNNLDSKDIKLINNKYGLEPNFTSNQLLLFFRAFSTEKDDNGNYLAYVNLIRLTTPKGTYAVNYTSDSSPKSINFDNWLASEGLTNMLKVDSDNYYLNIEVSWSLEEPLPPGVAEWGNVATIMARIMASVTTLLSINIGFITLGNLLLIVISLSILFFVIKVWKGGN